MIGMEINERITAILSHYDLSVNEFIGKATDDDDGHEFYYGKVQLGL